MALNFFNIQLIRLFNEFVPVRTFKPKKNPWFNHEIASAIVERNIAYRLWIADRTAFNHNQFKRMRNKVTSLINNAKTRYVSNNFTASNSSKDLWKRIKNLNITKPSDCSSKFDNNNDEINDYFCSNFTSDEELLPVPPSNEYGFKFSEILHDDIIIAINSIKSNAVGLDEIPLRFVKLLFPSICPMIHYIFNLIISTSKFPQAWKTSKVIPIKKKARTLSLDNLRPISILCAISKIFERILKNQIQAKKVLAFCILSSQVFVNSIAQLLHSLKYTMTFIRLLTKKVLRFFFLSIFLKLSIECHMQSSLRNCLHSFYFLVQR